MIDPLLLLSSPRAYLESVDDPNVITLFEQALELIAPKPGAVADCERALSHRIIELRATATNIRPSEARVKADLEKFYDGLHRTITAARALPTYESLRLFGLVHCTRMLDQRPLLDELESMRTETTKLINSISVSRPAQKQHVVAILSAEYAYEHMIIWSDASNRPKSSVGGTYMTLAGKLACASGLPNPPSVVRACRAVLQARRAKNDPGA